MSQLQLSSDDFEAVIFDMDGTMVDNMRAHKKAWAEFLKQHGITLSDEEFQKHISGKKNDLILEYVLGHMPSPEESVRLADEKEALYRKLYAPEIKEVAGLSRVIQQIQAIGLTMAIATTAPAKNRTFVLESLNLEGTFEHILGDEHVTKGKPHPEIYLKTADNLGVDPSSCLVFEDTPSGVSSAKGAEMTVVAILTSHTKEELKEANYFIKDFEEVSFS